jgi:hypothetical protein
MLTFYPSDASYPPQKGPLEPEPVSPNRKRSHKLFLESSLDQIPSPKRNCSGPIAEWLESIPSESCEEESAWPDAILEDPGLNMEYIQDADGYVIPPTPTRSSGAPSNISVSSAGSSRKKLVEDPSYRQVNLGLNNIYLRPPTDPVPEHVAQLLTEIRRSNESPSPSLDQVRQDADLQALEMCASETEVEQYFNKNLFPVPGSSETLRRTDKNPMSKNTVPEIDSRMKLSTPVPDALFGYNRMAFFQHKAHLIMADEFSPNPLNIVFPFLLVEFKGDGPSGNGSLWAATNQCLGGSASCINISERLNRRVGEYNIEGFNTTVFSIAMSGSEARLFVSWKQDNVSYYTQKVDSFALQRAEHYLEFRNYVLNIIDWGLKTRLERIQTLLDQLFEEDRKALSQMAKSRQPPSDDTSNEEGSKKRRDSSSSARRGRPRRVQEPGPAE